MNKRLFLLLLLADAALLVVLLLSIDTATAARARAVQPEVWQTASRTAVFLRFHLLFISVFSVLGGLSALFLLCPAARFFLFAGLAGLILYYRIDPRYGEGDFPAFVRALIVFASGTVLAFFSPSKAGVKMQFAFPVTTGLAAVAASRLLTHLAPAAVFTSGGREAAVLMFIFLTAHLSTGAIWGRAAHLFAKAAATEAMTKRWKSFAYLVLFFLAGSLFVLPVRNLVWLPALPFVSLFMAFYAPYRWFSQPGAPGLFDTAGFSPERSQLYLSFFFQYLSVLAAGLVCLSLKNKNRLLFIAAHVALFLYLLPGLWVFMQSAG